MRNNFDDQRARANNSRTAPVHTAPKFNINLMQEHSPTLFAPKFSKGKLQKLFQARKEATKCY